MVENLPAFNFRSEYSMQEKNNKYERNEGIKRATDEQHAPSVRSDDSTLVESVNMKQEIRTTNLEPHEKIPNNRTVQTHCLLR